MKILNSYIFNTVLASILVVLLIILGIDFISRIVDEMGRIRGDYTFFEVIIFDLLKLPGTLYEMLPFAALIGSLVGLGTLANSSELTVIRASGVSSGRIVWMVMRPVMVLILIGILIGEFFAPQLDQMAMSRRDLLRESRLDQNTETSLWVTDGNEFVHADTVFPNGVLYGVTRYEFSPQKELRSISQAFRVEFMGTHWMEENVRVSHFKEDQIEAENLPNREWNTLLTPSLLNVMVLDPDQLSIRDLAQYTASLETISSNGARYKLAFWNKILQPLAVAGLVLVAISFIFGSIREVQMGQRVFVGVLLGVIFMMSQKMLGPASIVYGFPAFVAVMVPIFFMLGLGGFLLWLRK